MKKCSICKETKNRIDFPFQNKSIWKIMSACKYCKSKIEKEKRLQNTDLQREKDRIAYQKYKEKRIIYAKEYRKKYPDRTRATNWKAKYWITPDDFYRKLELQENKCAICKRTMEEYWKIFCVDHNHITWEIRWLLCDPCNYWIWFYEKHSNKYIEYLSKYKN